MSQDITLAQAVAALASAIDNLASRLDIPGTRPVGRPPNNRTLQVARQAVASLVEARTATDSLLPDGLTSKDAPEVPTVPEPVTQKVTLEDLRTVGVKLVQEGPMELREERKEVLKGILAQLGVARLTETPPERYQEAMGLLIAALPKGQ